MCILCRKKQEILIQSGSWVHPASSVAGTPSLGGGGASDPILNRMREDIQGMGIGTTVGGPPSFSGSQASTPTLFTATTPSAAAAQHHHQQQQPYSLPAGLGTPSAAAGGSSTITSFFNRALSLTPSTPNLPTSLFGTANVSSSGFPSSPATAGSERHRRASSSSFLQRGVSLDRPSSSLSRPFEGLFSRSPAASVSGAGASASARAPLRQQRSLEGASDIFPLSLSRRISATFMGSTTSEPPPPVGRYPPSPSSSISSSIGPYSITGEVGIGGGGGRRIWTSRQQHQMRMGRLGHGLSVDSGGTAYSPHAAAAAAAAAARGTRGSSAGGAAQLPPFRRRSYFSGGEFATMSAPEDNIVASSSGGVASGGEEVMSPGGNIKSVGFFTSGAGSRRGVGGVSFGVAASDSEARDLCPPMQYSGGASTPSGAGSASGEGGAIPPATSSRARSFGSSGGGGSRRRMDSSFRTDSLSSDQSEQQGQPQPRPHPPRPHKRRSVAAAAVGVHGSSGVGVSASGGLGLAGATGGASSRRGGRPHGLGGTSSEEEDVRSTPDYTSCGDEMESESISEIGE